MKNKQLREDSLQNCVPGLSVVGHCTVRADRAAAGGLGGEASLCQAGPAGGASEAGGMECSARQAEVGLAGRDGGAACGAVSGEQERSAWWAVERAPPAGKTPPCQRGVTVVAGNTGRVPGHAPPRHAPQPGQLVASGFCVTAVSRAPRALRSPPPRPATATPPPSPVLFPLPILSTSRLNAMAYRRNLEVQNV